jgi:DNA replication and repair protein RecF
MHYQQLHLQGFRSYIDHTVRLNAGVTIVVGPNGSGKTNLLEALYVISTGSSFRGTDRELLNHDSDYFRLEATHDDDVRSLTYNPTDAQSPKHFSLDGVKRVRLNYQQKIPVVLFEPDHLRLLSGPPSARRDYLDAVLARLQPDFARQRSQFERALLQRNNILKHAVRRSNALEDQLFAWNIKLAELSEYIVERRLGLVTFINERINRLYSHIADTPTDVVLRYESKTSIHGYKQILLQQLDESLDKDLARGYTRIGPQRDDFALHLNNAPSAATASRGEMRTLLLALKMCELALLHDQSTRPPLLLLDDVFSELDSARRRTLATLARPYQTIITMTDADIVKGYFSDNYKIIDTVHPQKP